MKQSDSDENAFDSPCKTFSDKVNRLTTPRIITVQDTSPEMEKVINLNKKSSQTDNCQTLKLNV